MVENVNIYYLYDEPFGVDAMLDVFEAVTGLDGFAVAQTPGSPGYVREKLEKGWDTLVSCTYDSLHPTVGVDPEPHEFFELPAVELYVETKKFEERHYPETEIAEHLEDTVELVRRVYEASLGAGHRPVYVVGADPSHVDLLRRGSDFLRSTTEGVLAGEVEELYWLQVLRPATVESVGRETIESAPVARVEELSDGSVLLVAYENPKDRGDFRSLLEHFSLDWEDY